MAFKSDVESSDSGSNAQGRQPEAQARANSAQSSTTAVAGSSASQDQVRQSDGEGLALPDEWAGHQAVLEAREDGMNLSDFLASDSDSHDAPFRSPARPGLSRQNSLNNGPPPTLVRQNSMERAVTTRNMMNNYADAQRAMGQQPNGASGSAGFMGNGTSAQSGIAGYVDQSFAQQPQQVLMRLGHDIGGYAGMTMPPAVQGPSTSYAPAISGQAIAMMPSTNDGQYQVKVEPIDYPSANPQGFDVTVDQSTNPKENSYKWSPEFSRLYVDWNKMVALNVHLPQARGVYLLRAKFVYKDIHAPVDRCADCRNRPGEDAKSLEHPHVVRFGGTSGQYFETHLGERYAENRIEFADEGSAVTRTAILFSCRNSCDKANRNRERALILELLGIESQMVIGRKEFSVRVCASPTRDYENDLEKAAKQKRLSRKSNSREAPAAGGSSSDDQQSTTKKKAKRQTSNSGAISDESRMMSADFVYDMKATGRLLFPPENATPELREFYYFTHKCAVFYKYCKECHPQIVKVFKEAVFHHSKPAVESPNRPNVPSA